MKAIIFSHQICIGTTELRLGDESMGCLYGNFLPTENYYEFVQKFVWNFWSKNRHTGSDLTSVMINAQLDNGYFLFAAGGFTINDIQDLPYEPKSIDIAGVDRQVIEDFFLQPQPRPFVEEPWESISIEQKIGFENELKKELGINRTKPYLKFFNSTVSTHILANFEISALCHDQRNDDVLFVTRQQNHRARFAVVHLTWKGAQEIENYPRVEFYNSFDDFKYTRMYPDKADWKH